jgi:hypothetical protein
MKLVLTDIEERCCTYTSMNNLYHLIRNALFPPFFSLLLLLRNVFLPRPLSSFSSSTPGFAATAFFYYRFLFDFIVGRLFLYSNQQTGRVDESITLFPPPPRKIVGQIQKTSSSNVTATCIAQLQWFLYSMLLLLFPPSPFIRVPIFSRDHRPNFVFFSHLFFHSL